MSWAIGYDNRWKRDIGYGVPAYCDHPECDKEIDRGLSFVCGGEPYGGEHGCGLYFCADHLVTRRWEKLICERCTKRKEPFTPKPEHPAWLYHKMTDKSWILWRMDNPEKVTAACIEIISSSWKPPTPTPS